MLLYCQLNRWRLNGRNEFRVWTVIQYIQSYLYLWRLEDAHTTDKSDSNQIIAKDVKINKWDFLQSSEVKTLWNGKTLRSRKYYEIKTATILCRLAAFKSWFMRTTTIFYTIRRLKSFMLKVWKALRFIRLWRLLCPMNLRWNTASFLIHNKDPSVKGEMLKDCDGWTLHILGGRENWSRWCT